MEALSVAIGVIVLVLLAVLLRFFLRRARVERVEDSLDPSGDD